MARRSGRPQVLLIGADGADPAIMEQLMAAGRLPNMMRLREEGAYGRMRTTYPPVSPVAWTSLLTGRWPAEHGITDFVSKADGSYRPTIGLYELQRDSLGRTTYRSRRTAPTVAERLSEHGLSSYLLHVPGTFPATPLQGGMLAGLGTPDLLGTFGVPALYAADRDGLERAVRGRPEVDDLTYVEGGAWTGQIRGPADASLPFAVRQGRGGVVLTLEGGSEAFLARGAWSPWIDVLFPGHLRPDGRPLSGMCRFHVLRTDPDLLLYRTSLHHRPADPGVPLCWPPDFAPRCASRLGPFPTASFPMEQSAYQHGLLPADAFLSGAYEMWEQQGAVARALLTEEDWDFCLLHLFTLDSLQHLFWPDIDGEIARGYAWIDRVVGELRSLVAPDAVILVASDHGVAPLDRWVHLNSWLQQEGFLALDEDGRVDWRHTLAFCLGYGGIYLNVVGRDPVGQVEPGRPYERLRDELARRLLAWRDGDGGAPVVGQALPREAWGAGPHLARMPDLIVALNLGYGLAREDARGGVAAGSGSLEPNLGRWRGGHEGPYAPDTVAGIFLGAGPGIEPARLEGFRIVDVAPLVMRLLGLPTSS